MAAKGSKAVAPNHLRTKNSRIKTTRQRNPRFDATAAPINKRISPSSQSRPSLKSLKRKGKYKRIKALQLPLTTNVTYHLIRDVELINKFCQENQTAIKVYRLNSNVQIAQENVPVDADADTEAEEELDDPDDMPPPTSATPTPTPPTNDNFIDELISIAVTDMISQETEEIALNALSEAALNVVNEAVSHALSKTLTRVLTQAIKEAAGIQLNEAVLQAINLPSPSPSPSTPPPPPISDQSIQISEGDIMSSFDSLVDDQKNQLRSLSNLIGWDLDDYDDESPPPSPVISDEDEDCQIILDKGQKSMRKSLPLQLPSRPSPSPQPPFSLPSQITPLVVSSPNSSSYCCNPPSPPPNTVLTFKDNIIPLLSLPELRSYYVRPKSPELITIRSRSSSPSPQKLPPPLIPCPSISSSSPQPGPSRISSTSLHPHAPSVSSSSSSDSDPDYNPTQPTSSKPKKKRRFTRFKSKQLYNYPSNSYHR